MKNKKTDVSAGVLKTIGFKSTAGNKIITILIPILFFGICQMLVSYGVLGSLFEGLLVPLCFYIIMAVSLNLTVGILGELSLGHAGFMCVGAYVGGIFSFITQETITSPWIRFPLAILIGGLAAAIFGLLIGIPILRLSGDYLAIVTLAFGEIVKNIMQNIYLAKDINGLHFSFATAIDPAKLDMATKVDILKGPMALKGVPRDANLIVALVLVVITLIVILNLIDSRTGRAIMSIRDNRIAAESSGINITKYKLIVFGLSAFFAGVAGVLASHYNMVTEAKKFDYNTSILILVFVVLGGLGKMRGTIIATILLYALPELLRGLQSYRMLVYAIVLIVMMIVNNNPWFIEQRKRLKAFLFKNKKAEMEEN